MSNNGASVAVFSNAPNFPATVDKAVADGLVAAGVVSFDGTNLLAKGSQYVLVARDEIAGGKVVCSLGKPAMYRIASDLTSVPVNALIKMDASGKAIVAIGDATDIAEVIGHATGEVEVIYDPYSDSDINTIRVEFKGALK